MRGSSCLLLLGKLRNDEGFQFINLLFGQTPISARIFLGSGIPPMPKGEVTGCKRRDLDLTFRDETGLAFAIWLACGRWRRLRLCATQHLSQASIFPFCDCERAASRNEFYPRGVYVIEIAADAPTHSGPFNGI